MIAAPLNDEPCLDQVTARAVAAMHRRDVQELAARLGTLEAADRYIRLLPQREDGPTDDTPGPRAQCDVPQRVRPLAEDPNCVERALLRMALGELLDPRPVRQLMTIELDNGLRHTMLVENDEPVWLDPIVPRNALYAGLHLHRNASGILGTLLAPVDALNWAVGLATDTVKDTAKWVARHQDAVKDVARIAGGLLPLNPQALTWALSLAVPEAVAFGPDGIAALMSAAKLLDAIIDDKPKGSTDGKPPSPRNASFFAVKTPGVIADEIATTGTEIQALDRDITRTFAEPRDAQQRMFVVQWRAFVSEWDKFVVEHKSWVDRLWGGTYDKAIEFRQRAIEWRRRFEGLGGEPTAPPPTMPPEGSAIPWKPILAVAGVGAAALIVPALLQRGHTS